MDLVEKRDLEWIDPQEIDFGLRYRDDYGDLGELMTSVKDRGIITPVAVADKQFLTPEQKQELQETDPDKQFLLIAGGRRTRVSLNLKLPSIPAQIFHHMPDELELRLLEKDENEQRKDTDFREKVKLNARIHELMVQKFGRKERPGPGQEGVSINDVAKAIDVAPITLAQDVKLAQAFDVMPELSEAKNRTDAWKIYDAVVKRAAVDELQRRHLAKQALSNEAQHKRAIMSRYKVGDFFEGVQEVNDRSISLVEIDPPFAINLTEIKREGKTEHYNEIEAWRYTGFMKSVLDICYQKMADNSWLLCWFAPDPWFEPIARLIELAGKPDDVSEDEWLKSGKGLTLRRTPLLWTKRNGQTNQPNYHLANAAEMCFYARKGNPGISKQGRINVYEYAPVDPKKKIHPTERPIEMIGDILTTFNRVGRQVMVPFAGSGNTILAATNHSMPVIGWDLSSEYKKDFDARVLAGEVGKYHSY